MVSISGGTVGKACAPLLVVAKACSRQGEQWGVRVQPRGAAQRSPWAGGCGVMCLLTMAPSLPGLRVGLGQGSAMGCGDR